MSSSLLHSTGLCRMFFKNCQLSFRKLLVEMNATSGFGGLGIAKRILKP